MVHAQYLETHWNGTCTYSHIKKVGWAFLPDSMQIKVDFNIDKYMYAKTIKDKFPMVMTQVSFHEHWQEMFPVRCQIVNYQG